MKHYSAVLLTDDKATSKRRFRNILANSGEIMESGETRNLEALYVMGRDGKLIKVSDLDKNPEKQTEKYSVKAQADHGELIDGEPTPTIEKQFGSCKVWLENDGLHARMYFANDDKLADHAWAISEDASYSTGIDWYDDGYYGVSESIDQPIGILREVSMVLTGNDPRAMTIDSKNDAKAQRGAKLEDTKQENKENKMSMKVKKIDELTPDERTALGEELSAVLDKFTTDAPESETEPTEATNSADEKVDEGEAKTEEAPAKTADTLRSNVVVIRDRAVKQEVSVKTSNDWLTSKEGHSAFANTLKKTRRFGAEFDALWRQELGKHMSLDDITGLPTPAAVEQIFESALENADNISSHFNHLAVKSLYLGMFNGDGETDRAQGWREGDDKRDQNLAIEARTLLNKMVYKKLSLNAMELYENPQLIDFRARELVNAIVLEIERAAIIGDGRTAPTGDEADYRMFDGTRGFYSIAADAAATSGVGTYYASSVARTAGDGKNLYDLTVEARGQIRTEGSQYIVAKSSAITALMTAKVGDAYLVQPGASLEDILGVVRVYTPAWMENDATNDAYLIVDGAYVTIGDNNINTRTAFDTTKNLDILLDETPRAGSLSKYRSAVAIATAPSA